MLGYGFPSPVELIVVGGMVVVPIASMVLLVLVIVVAMRSEVKPKTHACADCGIACASGECGCSDRAQDIDGAC